MDPSPLAGAGEVKRYHISDLAGATPDLHVLSRFAPGKRIYKGGVAFHGPGNVSHGDERPHVEIDHEIFCLLQGEGWIEIDGIQETAQAGDIIVIEPGEDHHLVSSHHNPFINLWLHADEAGHPDQASG